MASGQRDMQNRAMPSTVVWETGMSYARRRFARYGIRDEGPYTDAEWDVFIDCAHRYCERPDTLHRDLPEKMAERGISARQLLGAVNAGAKLAAYEHYGDHHSKRLMLWCPVNSCVVIASREDGLILTVIEMGPERFMRYATARQNANLRWLRP